MATGSKNLITQTFTAASAMSAASQQFCFVKLLTGRQVCPVDANTDIPIGVLQNSPALGEPAVVALSGQTKLVAGATNLAEGAVIGADATGRAIALTAGTSTGFYVAGRVISVDASTNAGGLVSAVVDCAKPTRNL